MLFLLQLIMVHVVHPSNITLARLAATAGLTAPIATVGLLASLTRLPKCSRAHHQVCTGWCFMSHVRSVVPIPHSCTVVPPTPHVFFMCSRAYGVCMRSKVGRGAYVVCVPRLRSPFCAHFLVPIIWGKHTIPVLVVPVIWRARQCLRTRPCCLAQSAETP